MRSGVSYPSYAREAQWTATSAAADFPASNAALIDEPRRPWVAAAAGAQMNLQFELPVARTIDFVALIHHNIPSDATWRVRLYADPNLAGANVYDSTLVSVWPGGSFGSTFPAVRPLKFDPAVCRSGLISILAPGTVLEIGAVELGRFWAWSDVGVDRVIGLESTSEVVNAGGVDHVTRQWAPRTFTGNRKVVEQSAVDITMLDFQRDMNTTRAFVWCWDVDDATTWARQAWLATNARLPAGSVYDYEVGQMAFDFVEHLE